MLVALKSFDETFGITPPDDVVVRRWYRIVGLKLDEESKWGKDSVSFAPE